MNEPQKADGEKESAELGWPNVLRIASSEEFQQSVAVAQLAVRLCELELRNPSSELSHFEKQNLNPKKFLAEAWALIQSASKHVIRPQTDAEYLAVHGGRHEAAENVVARKLAESRVSFEDLCDPECRDNDDTKLIHGVNWIVYRSERGLDNLFLAYWNDLGEQWIDWMKGEKPRPLWMKRDAVTFAKLAHNRQKYPGGFKQLWKERGKSVLASWKTDGVPRNDFLALARFRREHDKRAANLKKKPKPKRKRLIAKARA